jgi:hypothetical protein
MRYLHSYILHYMTFGQASEYNEQSGYNSVQHQARPPTWSDMLLLQTQKVA